MHSTAAEKEAGDMNIRALQHLSTEVVILTLKTIPADATANHQAPCIVAKCWMNHTTSILSNAE